MIDNKKRLKEIFYIFFRMGMFAFGGPAAHIAMMEEEVITKRKWISRQEFIDMIGATNLIPGPNSTELAILIGNSYGGKIGLFLAGISFITPAMLIIFIFAIVYKIYGDVPQVESILYGIKPVIMVIILNALYRLSKSVIKDKLSILLVAFVITLYAIGISEVPLLSIAALIMLIIKKNNLFKNKLYSLALVPLYSIFFIFLKIGAVLYGSGYVLLAFLEREFVSNLGVLTNQQLLDAVAIGQFTPGPIFTTATFIGYLLNGIPGGLVATIGIFIPSFLVVLILHPLIPKIRSSFWASALLDGVNIGSLGLMAVVSFKLGISSIIDPFTLIVFFLSLSLTLKYKVNSIYLIIGGGLAGFITQIPI